MLHANVMEGSTVTRVLVVQSRERDSKALELLERAADVSLLDPAPDLDEALRRLKEDTEAPDVVIVGLEGPDGVTAVEATRRVRGSAPEAKILLLVSDHLPREIAEAVAAGASGIVHDVGGGLVDIVRRASAGELVLPERHLAAILAHLQRGRRGPAGDAALRRLTPRETEILRSLAGGASPPEIAVSLGISTLTVQSHVKSILAKLGVHSKIEAITLAWRHGVAASPRSA